jgi:hypothetical protein
MKNFIVIWNKTKLDYFCGHKSTEIPMKKRYNFPILLMSLAVLAIAGCSKSTTDPLNNTTTTTTSSGVSYHFNDASGMLVAVKTVTLISAGGLTFPSEMNVPLAVFPTSVGGGTYQDAGTVTFNTRSLAKQSNNSYLYTDLTNPVSYDQQHWTVSGSSGVPAIDYSDNTPFPAYSGQSSLPTAVTRSSGLTVNLGSAISNADSVYVELISIGNSKTVLKRVGGSAGSAVFSTTDLSELATGSAYLEVVPWSYKTEDLSSKLFYFILESAYVVTVTVN